MLIAAFTAVVYIFNGIVWALLDAFIAPILPKHEAKKTTKRSKK
jgi:hypothetical protein